MLKQIRSELDLKNARLVAVSKTHPVARILEVYEQGQRIFGENRPQEMLEKQSALPADIEWHLIGHLQTNKVKSIAPFVSLIHSVDSLRLLQEIDKQALKYNRVIDCLLQFHIAQEETKFGLSESTEAIEILQDPANFQPCKTSGFVG
jgi:pyridoxal phosphate enzyme (YggS family)